MINIDLVLKTAEDLMQKAAIEIPEDYLGGLKRAAADEEGALPSFVLKVMLENYEVAKEDRCAMCGDTGVPRWFVKLGNEAQVEGGMIALEAALRRATASATNGVPLRPNRVHPLWRTDHNNNVGIGAPEIEYGFEPERTFYVPKYASYQIDSYKKYGVIHWIPKINLTSDSLQEIKFENTNQDEIIFFIEGMSSNGDVFSQKVILNQKTNN